MSGSWACSPLQPHSSTALLSALLVDGWQVQVPKCPRDSPLTVADAHVLSGHTWVWVWASCCLRSGQGASILAVWSQARSSWVRLFPPLYQGDGPSACHGGWVRVL